MSINQIAIINFIALVFVSPGLACAEMAEGTVKDASTGAYVNINKNFQEGIVLREDGNYVVTYKDSSDSYNEVVLVPATKIEPKIKSKFKKSESGGAIFYRYDVSNGRTAKQNIIALRTAVTNVNAGSPIAPAEWKGLVSPMSGNAKLHLSWNYWTSKEPRGIKPGRTMDGFALESFDLPGVAVMETAGERPTTEWLGEYPQGAIGDQVAQIEKKNFIERWAAVPTIPVATPFSAATVIAALQQHADKDLLSMKLIDASLIGQMDRLFMAAIEAAKIDNEIALKSNLNDIRRLLKKEHGDLESEDRDDEKVKANTNAPVIDKLAARVLDFDVRYVLGRVGNDE